VILPSAVFAVVISLTTLPVSAQEVEFNYNGRVKVNGLMFSGQGQFKFALVSKDGEATFWTNDGLTTSTAMPTATVTVDVTDGFFSVNVGDAELPGMAALTKDVFARDEDMYLRVWFNDGTRGFEMLIPDRKITNTDLLGLKISKVKDYTIYVNATTGNDKHLGLTPEKPKKTIQSAIDTLPPLLECNVTIDIADGVYREQVSIIGINAMPGRKLMLLGDEEWTTSTVAPPRVQITGSDGETTGTRDYGFYAEGSAGLALKGFLVDGCAKTGIKLSNCEGADARQCNLSNNGLYGFDIGGGNNVSVSDCVATANWTGFNILSSSILFLHTAATNNQAYGFNIGGSPDTRLVSVDVLSNGVHGVCVRSSFVEFRGVCRFSGHTYCGIKAEVYSTLFFYKDGVPAYAGEIKNNGQYGVMVAFNSMVMYSQGTNVFANNLLADYKTFTGGVLYY
jgi:hypothetical protein